MKFASFALKGKETYGVVTAGGVIDLGSRYRERWPTLRAVLIANALPQVRDLVAGMAADHGLSDILWLPVLPDADKVMCIGRNYRDYAEEVGSELPEIHVSF